MHTPMTIAIGCDHAGVDHKNAVRDFLSAQGMKVLDMGTNTTDSVDYPDYAHPVARSVETAEADFGILICGSANGVCITANKHAGVRAALCWRDDVAALARQHNNANVICLPARFISIDEARQFVETFLNTAFEGGRHEKRVEKIAL